VSTQQRKKDQELHYVEVFRRAFPAFPGGELLADEDQERPDIIVAGAQGRLGIEVTRILHEPLKRTESESEAMVSAACSIYEERNLPNLHLGVFLSAQTPFNKQNRKALATALADLVTANIPAPNGITEPENDWGNASAFPFEIRSVLIWRPPSLSRNCWTVASFGWIRENFAQTLQETIAKKEARILGYDTGCDALWLLIVGENSSPSAFFNPSESTLSHPYVSSFDRVFFLELFQAKASELRIAKQGCVTTPKPA
jgi:hypothetical protein